MKTEFSLGMKSFARSLGSWLFNGALVVLAWAISPSVQAQSGAVTNIHDFAGFNPAAYGGVPSASLIAAGNVSYGTAAVGGSFIEPGSFGISPEPGAGVMFKINHVGSGYTVLHTFSGVNVFGNSEGAYPLGSLVLCGNTLYGTTFIGGAYGYGTIFAVNTDGSRFTSLYSFTGALTAEIRWPGWSCPVNVLYGAAFAGGTGGDGTIFSLNTDGSGFNPIYEFTAADYPDYTQCRQRKSRGKPGSCRK